MSVQIESTVAFDNSKILEYLSEKFKSSLNIFVNLIPLGLQIRDNIHKLYSRMLHEIFEIFILKNENWPDHFLIKCTMLYTQCYKQIQSVNKRNVTITDCTQDSFIWRTDLRFLSVFKLQIFFNFIHQSTISCIATESLGQNSKFQM